MRILGVVGGEGEGAAREWRKACMLDSLLTKPTAEGSSLRSCCLRSATKLGTDSIRKI